MSAHIPFVNTDRDCDILNKYYKDTKIVRISIESIDKVKNKIPKYSLWIDPAIDAYSHILDTNWPIDIIKQSPKTSTLWPLNESGEKKDEWKIQSWNRWEKLFKSFKGYKILTHKNYWVTKYKEELKTFVEDILNKCCNYKPAWITVPQLPLVNDGTRNKINKMLAEITGEYKSKHGYKGKLILPLIFTKQEQLRTKPTRDKKIKTAKECYYNARADGLWIVDTSLADQSRNEKFPARYSKLIEFHENIKESFPEETIIIAGPYWGINLVLWAKELCDYPSISLGTGYTYNISCGFKKPGNVHLAISPLRRQVVVNDDLKSWITSVLSELGPKDPTHRDFEDLIEHFDMLRHRDAASNKVAESYKRWFDEIEIVPQVGRALALYQDLSSAYVLGKQLPSLPRTCLPNVPEKILEAGAVAEQLMLKCL